MHVEAMEVSRSPRVGDELMVACMAVGSSALRVRWFKDGFPVDPEVPFRSLWTSLVPKNSKDQFTALLAIDRASTHDAGVFTCQLESLRMGYLVSSPPQLASELRGYLSGRALGPGEGQPLVSLLAGLLGYLDHPLLRQGGRPARAAVEFMGDLQRHVLQFGLLASEALGPGTILNFDRPALVVALGRFTRRPGEPVVVNIPVGGSLGGSTSWAGNAVQLHLAPAPDEEEAPSEVLVAVALFKTLGELLPERFLARHGDQEDQLHELYSSLLGVALSKEEGVRVRVRLAHSRQGLTEGDQESDLIAGLGCGACLVLVLITLVVLLLRCCRY
ncbi:unnamed protein product, partial [Ixodes pacificus]